VLLLFQQQGLQKLFAHAFDLNHHSISVIKNLGMLQLQGNITKIIREGKERSILCFAADQSIVPVKSDIQTSFQKKTSDFFSADILITIAQHQN
jgi:hypothetical protein